MTQFREFFLNTEQKSFLHELNHTLSCTRPASCSSSMVIPQILKRHLAGEAGAAAHYVTPWDSHISHQSASSGPSDTTSSPASCPCILRGTREWLQCWCFACCMTDPMEFWAPAFRLAQPRMLRMLWVSEGYTGCLISLTRVLSALSLSLSVCFSVTMTLK